MPGAFVEQDLAGMFVTAEFASDATWTYPGGTAVPGRVIVDAQSADVLEQVTVRDLSILFETAQWPTVTDRDRIDIASVGFQVARVDRLSDGKISRAHLRRV